jgi:hypothetical protein
MRSRQLLSMLIAGCTAIAFASAAPVGSGERADRIISRIPREPVGSSAIAGVGYSKRLHILEIEFNNGAVYRYFDVPRAVYRNLMRAESKTRYYLQNIKGQYRSVRIRSWRKKEAH